MDMPSRVFDFHRHMNRTKGCSPVALGKGDRYTPSPGTIILNATYALTLTQNAIFEPACTGHEHPKPLDPSTILNSHEPFYASTFPQMYAVAAATVISYLLLIMLFITPRTFFIGGRGGAFLSRHGMISGSYGSSSVIGVGGRPWLQKVAALTVVISLSIATADSFAVAKEQYELGYMDSMALTNEVVNGVEIRVIRVISSTFLWLAQVQTLIRLFPRHKEKVIIKWVGFAMIVLDTIFSILNNTVGQSTGVTVRPRHIVDAIPALNYLFELSLSLLYAAWVIFYSISKHRFAFFHVNMRNICLVALLSLVAVLIPVVFFILDVSKPNVAGWGEYIRWVGAAAASVVVWEWVERIEALEREERKDGILGREIFDGDEMLEVTPSEEVDTSQDASDGNSDGKAGGGGRWASIIGRPLRNRARFRTGPRRKGRQHRARPQHAADSSQDDHPTAPPQAATTLSRADTASTVYRVRHHSVGSLSPSTSDVALNGDAEKGFEPPQTREMDHRSTYSVPVPAPHLRQGISWLHMLNPFGRRRGSPPQEVASAQAEEGNMRHPTLPEHRDKTQARSTLKTHLSTFRSFLHHDRESETSEPQRRESVLPITVIPARSRRECAVPHSTTHHSGTQESRNNDHDRGDSDTPLPVVVIPARPRVAKAWDSSAFEEYVRSRPSTRSPGQDYSQNDQRSIHPTPLPSQTEHNQESTGSGRDIAVPEFESALSEEEEIVENTSGAQRSRSSSDRTLINSVPPSSGLDNGRGQSPAAQQNPPVHPSRFWDDSGGTNGVT
ncbi:pH-response regulator protein palH/rim-21 [Coccidioides immitis H538.4]|uniref:pH-response regulator protein palH/rim-21 n=1 Tax=Coccidioides immitis H538.4 TaxID=396776 RepID=A0A0J8RLV0_COCIT|nr:pH-response regulator protein palH/rim-21 [Coccidioides immitis H538.4]